MTTTLTSRSYFTEPVEGLFASAPKPLPFAPSLHIRAFVLPRARGDLLVYSAPGVERAGLSRRYLNHSHEAMFAPADVDGPLFVHAADRDAVEDTGLHVRASFTKRHVLDEDFEVIPTPGHTPGATAYLWDSGQNRFLFTGDTVYLNDGEWVAAVLGSSDREAYVDSLDLIRGLDFDVLVPWAASAGRSPVAFTSGRDARRRIGVILDRLWKGEDH